MLREFVEANVAAVNGHGMRIGGEGDNAGAIIEFDIADLDFLGDGSRFAIRVEAIDFEIIFTVRNNGAGEVEKLGGGLGQVNVFHGALIIFGGEEIIAFLVMKPLADV